MGNFIYPRIVAVRRPGAQAQGGVQTTYAADRTSTETVIATGLPASIQFRREGTRGVVGLPGDGARPTWDVLIPPGAANPGQIMDRDIVIDDLGRRFQVLGDYSDSLGFKLRVERLES